MTGSPPLREAIASHLSTRHDRPVGVDQIVCTHGASAGLAATVLALVDPGDTVVIPEPTYSLYADHVAMAGGEVVFVAGHADGSIDVEAIERALTGARLLMLCSPGNPTGAVIGRDDLFRLSEAARAAGALLLCDEAYSEIVYDDEVYFSSLDLDDADHVISCHTFSKAYAMTGWRLGHVVAAAPLAESINLVHRTINGALSTFVQDAGVIALRSPVADLASLRVAYQDRRDMVVDALSDVPGVSMTTPQGAFYAFVRVMNALGSDEIVARMAAAGVLVRDGREFGPSGEGAFRISFATDIDELAAGLQRVVAVLRGLVT